MKEKISIKSIEVNGRIIEACEKYDRDADDITVIAVTKTHPASVINVAVASGFHNIGESRIQEAEPKIKQIGPIARFHLIGHLQSNKAKKAVELFDVIQSVDSLKLAEEISRQAKEIDRTLECYLQVNCSGELQKYGCSPDEAIVLAEQIHQLDNINLTGLMTIGPFVEDEDIIRSAYARCYKLYRLCRDKFGDDFDTLSMGMSNDLELAIAEGSNMLRIGSALFGPRDASNR